MYECCSLQCRAETFHIEEDKSLLLSSIQAMFPSAVGVRFKSKEEMIRSIRTTEDGTLCPPRGAGDWSRSVEMDCVNTSNYICIYETEFVST